MDSYTLVVATSLLSVVMTLIMFAMYKAIGEKCLFDWAIAGAVTALAYIWGSFTKDLSIYLNTAISNALFIAIYLAILRGVLRHLNKPLHTRLMLFLLALVWGLHFIPAIGENINNRIIMFALITAPIQLYLMHTLYQVWRVTKKWSYLPLLFIAIFPVMDLIFRAGAILSFDIAPTDSWGNHWIHTLGWAVNLLYTSTATFSCALIIVHQQFFELSEQKRQLEIKNEEVLSTQKELIQSKKMASIGTMTAGIAHEINNPTNFAYASVYMMEEEITNIKQFLKELAGGDQAEEKLLQSFDDKFKKLNELTATAKEGTDRIKSIVKDLQIFTKLDDELSNIPISQLLLSTVNLTKTQNKDTKIQLEIIDDPKVPCLPTKLNQVFMNVIMNGYQAIAARQDNEENLSGSIKITTKQNNDMLDIHFQDNGCGMPDEVIEKIFDPFFTTKEVGSGTGLGMAISYRIIEEHQGHISVKSKAGFGSEVLISIPVTPK